MKLFYPELVAYEKGLNSPLYLQIRNRILAGNQKTIFQELKKGQKIPFTLPQGINRQSRDKQFWSKTKKTLILRDKQLNRDSNLRFFHPFVSVDHIIEDYKFIISMENECPNNCLYCYLQASCKDTPVPTIFTNFQDKDDLIREIKLALLGINMYTQENGKNDCLGREGKAVINRLITIFEKSIGSVSIDLPINDIYKSNLKKIKENFQHSRATMIANYKSKLGSYDFEKPHTRTKFMAGEINDGLALDHLTDNSKYLVEIFANHTIKGDGGFLQFRTKSNNISNLKGIIQNDNTNISFSVNSPTAIRKFELSTASLDKRLSAARQLQDWGYKVKINVEPIIMHADTVSTYKLVLDNINDKLIIKPELLRPITLGMLRFGANILEIIQSRNPRLYKHYQDHMTDKLEHEKHRYPEKWRIKTYTELTNYINKTMPGIGVELSTEPRFIWEKVGLQFN